MIALPKPEQRECEQEYEQQELPFMKRRDPDENEIQLACDRILAGLSWKQREKRRMGQLIVRAVSPTTGDS